MCDFIPVFFIYVQLSILFLRLEGTITNIMKINGGHEDE